MKNKYLFICIVFLFCISCVPNTEDNLNAVTENVYVITPTPDGTWGGLPYRQYGWILTQFNSSRMTRNPILSAVEDGEKILAHPKIGGCMLSLTNQVREFYGDYRWTFDGYEIKLSLPQKLDAKMLFFNGSLVSITYIFDSGVDYSPTNSISGYIGGFVLDLFDEEEQCISDAEELLEQLDPYGLALIRKEFVKEHK